jgi:ribosomal protein L39E
MIEQSGNIFDHIGNCDAICITTNKIIKKNGDAVCGAGIALEAAKRYRDFPKLLAKHLKTNGNVPAIILKDDTTNICSFPTKNNWRDKSDIYLIIQSCNAIVNIANENNWKKVFLPVVGCGQGGLIWADVRNRINKILDNRFIIINNDTK